MARYECSIPTNVFEKWAKDFEGSRDAIAARVGAYMQKHNVSREVAIKKLNVPDPLTIPE